MKPYWIPEAWRWAAGLLGASVLLSAAERPCAPLPELHFTPPYTNTCWVTNYWTQPVDVDGDGVADFRHERNRAEHRIRGLVENPGYSYQDDEIEAYYPEPHVEMYVRVWSPEDVVLQDCKLAAGEMIEPEPPRSPRPYWTWSLPPRVRPAFEAHGLGIVNRRFERGGVMTGSPGEGSSGSLFLPTGGP